jgi:acyl dehydratase
MNHELKKGRAFYTSRDLIVYSFGVGCNPAEFSNEIKYLYEHSKQFTAFPTFLLSLPFRAADVSDAHKSIGPSHGFGMPHFPPPLMEAPSLASTQAQTKGPRQRIGAVIHLGQKFRLHKEIPSCSPDADNRLPVEVNIESRLLACRPHKNGKIATIESKFYVRDDSIAEKNKKDILIATSQMVTLYPTRFSDPAGSGATSDLSTLHPIEFNKMETQIEKSKPFLNRRYKIGNNQALLYRLSGDTNRIHVEGAPELFNTTQPILHGLCTLGYAVRAILSIYATGSEKCTYVECYFKRPVFVGDEIEVRVWESKRKSKHEDNEKTFLFEIRNAKTDAIVVDSGVAGLSGGLAESSGQDALISKL